MIINFLKLLRKNSIFVHRLPKEYRQLLGAHALYRLISNYEFVSVLDIGSGSGAHARLFRKSGKKVTQIDFGESIYFQECPEQSDVIVGDFNTLSIKEQYDCVWACHVYEHQENAQAFLRKIVDCTKDNGIIAITIPPPRNRLVGGHINLSTISVLIYRLILCGLDCHSAEIFRIGYNRTVILRKKTCSLPGNLSYDFGDVSKLAEFFPKHMKEGKRYW